MNDTLLPFVAMNPSTTPKATIIWLHGLGADGHDFTHIVPELQIPERLALRFIFPHAPIRPITVNNGYRMRGWYDITGFSLASREDEAGITETAQAIHKLIQHENNLGIPSNKIILGGFSQGGAIALHTGLRYPETLAGIMALSTYLPLAAKLPVERQAANQATSIFLAHGISDSVIPLAWAEMAKAQLTALGHPVAWHTYPMDHCVSLEEIQDIRVWVEKRIIGDH